MSRKFVAGKRRHRRSITVGTDFTTGSGIAVERAGQLALATNSRLQIVHVVSQSTMTPAIPLPSQWTTNVEPVRRPDAVRALRAAVELASRHLGAESPIAATSNLVRVGAPHAALARCAGIRQSLALVIGVHRPLSPGESFFLGSTAERALRDGSTPVLLARTRVTGPYRHALVALDLGELSLRVARTAATLMPDAEYDIVHFAEPLGLRGRGNKLQRENAAAKILTLCASVGMETSRARVHVLPGSPRGGILAEIRAHMPDVVVMGTHARRGLARMLLGSAADYVIHAAWNVDVLAVPPEN
jgi:nucleotide-binding universal stress UspA family protein